MGSVAACAEVAKRPHRDGQGASDREGDNGREAPSGRQTDYSYMTYVPSFPVDRAGGLTHPSPEAMRPIRSRQRGLRGWRLRSVSRDGKTTAAPPRQVLAQESPASACEHQLVVRAGLTFSARGRSSRRRSIDECGALVAEVRFAVHRLLDPDPVGLRDGVILVGEQREAERVLVVEFLDLPTGSGEIAEDTPSRPRSRPDGRARRTPVSCSRAYRPWGRSRAPPAVRGSPTA